MDQVALIAIFVIITNIWMLIYNVWIIANKVIIKIVQQKHVKFVLKTA